jgi:hypothetical protein
LGTMASADGELFKDVFVVDGVDMHEVDDGAGGVKKTKEKKFDKGTSPLRVSSPLHSLSMPLLHSLSMSPYLT